jgi:hypothetical protein
MYTMTQQIARLFLREYTASLLIRKPRVRSFAKAKGFGLDQVRRLLDGIHQETEGYNRSVLNAHIRGERGITAQVAYIAHPFLASTDGCRNRLTIPRSSRRASNLSIESLVCYEYGVTCGYHIQTSEVFLINSEILHV